MKSSLFICLTLLCFVACKSSGPGQDNLQGESSEKNVEITSEASPEETEEDLMITPVPSIACLKSCATHEKAQDRSDCTSEAIIAYVTENLKYPEVAKTNNVQGMAIISFQIDTDGSTSDLKIVKDPGGGCGEEAKRLVKEYVQKNEWQAAESYGTAIKSQYMIPIRFRL